MEKEKVFVLRIVDGIDLSHSRIGNSALLSYLQGKFLLRKTI